jgi:hypothetical protein
MAFIRDHRNGLLVIAGQDSQHRNSTLRCEANAVTNPELEHRLVGTQLIYEPKALHDAMIQVDEFSFGQMIYVNAIHDRFPAVKITAPGAVLA